MFVRHTLTLALAALPVTVAAQNNQDLQQIRNEIKALRERYETRITELELRLQQAEQKTGEAAPAPRPATPAANPAGNQAASPATSRRPRGNAFNPDISLILSGGYNQLQRDPATYRISGFEPSGEVGPGSRGFSLAESELSISGNIDPRFFGSATLAIEPDDTLAVEEAFVQTTALPAGFTVKAGRFFSGIGYLNGKHAHTWDFIDSPLAYQALLGGQFGDDGVQLKWLAPTPMFLEFGAELGRGRGFPGNDADRNGAGARAVFAHIGGDIGQSHSWRAGLSLLSTSAREREYEMEDLNGATVTNSFTGRSRVWLADFVWKWSPGGNGARQNLVLQGEYLRRNEQGSLVYDTAGAASEDGTRSRQSGWYLQALYQFMPGWRAGLRHDSLNSGTVEYGANDASLAHTHYRPRRNTAILEWKPSEFSRLRLQFARDKARQNETDNQVMLQYQMSLGAHGAHSY